MGGHCSLRNYGPTEKKVYLRPLFKGVVGATDGTETFESSRLFGAVGGETLSSGVGKPTPETPFIANEVVEDGTFYDIFGSLRNDRPRWQGQSQVVEFCRTHYHKSLSSGCCGAFFEIAEEGVACVYLDGHDSYLKMYVYRPSYAYIWFVEHHPCFVLPE